MGKAEYFPNMFFFVINIRVPNLYRMLLNDSLLMKIMGISSGKEFFPVESASAGLLIKHHFLCGELWEFCWGFMGSAELIEPIIFTNM